MKRGKKYGGKLYKKTGKMHLLVYKLKILAPPAANLLVGNKNESQKRGGRRNDRNAQYIPLGSCEIHLARSIAQSLLCRDSLEFRGPLGYTGAPQCWIYSP